VLGGELLKVPGELRRIRELGLSPVGLLLAFERRAAQLVQLAAKGGPRAAPADIVEREAGPMRIFWKDKRDIINQLGRWRGHKLDRLTQRLMALHAALMTHSQSAELLLAQELAGIARAAARRS
jgi:DNA polymerase-3 subunit delta